MGKNAQRRRLRKQAMAQQFKLMGPDGKPIPVPQKGQPLPQIPIASARLIAQIEEFRPGQFGIRRIADIASLDMVKVLCNLAASVVQVEQNKAREIIERTAELPPLPPPPGDHHD